MHIIWLNNTPVRLITKHPETVETSSYEAELVTAKITTVMIFGIQERS